MIQNLKIDGAEGQNIMNDERVTYTTIKHEAVAEFEEKRSLFIGHAKPVKTEEEVAEFIKEKKREFADATHNVFGYIIKNGICARYSDDGEPQGTAGMPVLDTIRKSGVSDACVVVTRYFGGILLGAGGLVRAYSNGAKIALEAAEIITYDIYREYSLECTYSDYQKLGTVFAGFSFRQDDAIYADNITIIGRVVKKDADEFEQKLVQVTSGRIKIEKLGEKFDF